MNTFINPTETYEIIINDNLKLRQVSPSEASDMFKLIDENREYLAKWLPFPEFTKTPNDSLEFINKIIQNRTDGTEYGFGIYVDGILVGHTSIMHTNDDKQPEIGYWIAKEYCGQGITTKTTIALTNFAKNILKINNIVIKADVDNISSNRVAEKSGYKFHRSEDDEKLGKINVWHQNLK